MLRDTRLFRYFTLDFYKEPIDLLNFIERALFLISFTEFKKRFNVLFYFLFVMFLFDLLLNVTLIIFYESSFKDL